MSLNVAVLLSSFVLLFANSAKAQDFIVTKKLQSRPVVITALNVELKSAVGGDPMQASAKFLISGKYETSGCSITDLFLHAVTNPSSSITEASGTLKLIGTEMGPVDLTELNCAGGSVGKFQVPLEVSIGMWSPDSTYAQWIYKIQTGRAPDAAVRTLTIRFDPKEGWRYKLQ
jgi:hypothetical protein